MWAVSGKKLSGTAQLRGDLENNFSQQLTKGVFYGMVDDGMLNDATYGANFTAPPKDATADFSAAKWYAIDEDVVTPDDSTERIKKEVRIPATPLMKRAKFDAKGRVQNLNGTRSRNKFYKLF